MTLWSGRVGGSLDPAVWAFLHADDAELLPYDCEASVQHAQRLHGAGLLSDEELAEAEARLAEIAHDPAGYLDEDEDVHSAIERQLGDLGRKIHAGRSRNDQVAAAFRLYVLDACARGARGDRRARARRPVVRGGRGRHADARLHAPPARPARDARASPPRLGRDARPRPHPLRRRRRRRRSRARSARARSPARRSASPGLPARCATRSTPSPTATSRSTTSTRSPCSTPTSRGSARSSCSGRRASSAS